MLTIIDDNLAINTDHICVTNVFRNREYEVTHIEYNDGHNTVQVPTDKSVAEVVALLEAARDPKRYAAGEGQQLSTPKPRSTDELTVWSGVVTRKVPSELG